MRKPISSAQFWGEIIERSRQFDPEEPRDIYIRYLGQSICPCHKREYRESKRNEHGETVAKMEGAIFLALRRKPCHQRNDIAYLERRPEIDGIFIWSKSASASEDSDTLQTDGIENQRESSSDEDDSGSEREVTTEPETRNISRPAIEQGRRPEDRQGTASARSQAAESERGRAIAPTSRRTGDHDHDQRQQPRYANSSIGRPPSVQSRRRGSVVSSRSAVRSRSIERSVSSRPPSRAGSIASTTTQELLQTGARTNGIAGLSKLARCRQAVVRRVPALPWPYICLGLFAYVVTLILIAVTYDLWQLFLGYIAGGVEKEGDIGITLAMFSTSNTSLIKVVHL